MELDIQLAGGKIVVSTFGSIEENLRDEGRWAKIQGKNGKV